MQMYDLDDSGNCYKVRLLAAQLALDLELVPLDEDQREATLSAFNPVLEVPTLLLDDGRSLCQSAAILLYLAEGTPYLPEDPFERAKVVQWLFFEQTTHEPISYARFWLRWGNPGPSAPPLAACQSAGYEALGVIDSTLADRDFIVGDTYTVADIALYAYTHIAAEGGFDLGRFPSVWRWLERVAAQPGHIPMLP